MSEVKEDAEKVISSWYQSGINADGVDDSLSDGLNKDDILMTLGLTWPHRAYFVLGKPHLIALKYLVLIPIIRGDKG